jgi:hypothetical protein
MNLRQQGDGGLNVRSAVLSFFDQGPRKGEIFRLTGNATELTAETATGGLAIADSASHAWRLQVEGFRPNLRPIIVASERNLEISIAVDGSVVETAHDDPDVQALRVLALLDPRIVLSRANEVRLEPSAIEVLLDLRQLGLPGEYLEWLGPDQMERRVRVIYEGDGVAVSQLDVPPQERDTIAVRYR